MRSKKGAETMYKHRIEYYDNQTEQYNVFYVYAKSYREAIAIFREDYSKDKYKIVEVAKVYENHIDWSKF